MTNNTQIFETIIGLEIHIQLNTKSKMFSSASNRIWQALPNSLVSPVELGLPGALPVPNKEAIAFTQRFGHAIGCNLNRKSKFDRKNYFYPDLPKGYQISQYDEPFCYDGFLEIRDAATKSKKRINIRRIHLEEDTGKSSHHDGETYLDFNKAGVPLMELVTEPDFRSADEVSDFAKMIQEAVRVLKISDADMEKGNLRLEANISVRRMGETQLPDYRVEVKNINSFKFMRDAINYEVKRQISAIENGISLDQETRGWNPGKGETYVQRSKENAHDYRYFPEPDIPPFEFSDEYFEAVLRNMPQMPWNVEDELYALGVRPDYAGIIAYNTDKYDVFKANVGKFKETVNELSKIIVNTNSIGEINEKLDTLNSKPANQSLDEEKVNSIVKMVLETNSQAVNDYHRGKENAISFLVGCVMKELKGQVSPQLLRELMVEKLKSSS